MKGLKKVLALVLSVCMLIGMPLSINVGAAEDALKVVSAMLVPEHIANDSNSTGLDAAKSIHLYFNKAANVDLNKTKAVVVRCNVNGVAINYWTAKLAKNTAFGDTNNLVVTIDNTTLASIKSDWNNSWGADRIVVRLFDATTGIDHKFSGISDGTTPMAAQDSYYYGGCQTNGNINTGTISNNVCDFVEIPITTMDEMATLVSANWADEDKVEITFAQPIVTDAITFYSGMRIVNSKNETMIYRPNAEVKYATESVDGAELLQAAVTLTDNAATTTATITETSLVGIDGFDENSVKTYSWFKAHLDACQAENPDDTFRIVYALEDADQQNWYIDGLLSANTGSPMIAMTSKDKSIVKTTSFADPLVLEDVKFLDAFWVEMTFSEEVTFNGAASFGLAIVQDGAIKERIWQGSWTWNGQSCGTTFNKTWRMMLNSDSQPLVIKYINQYKAQGAKLCFYFREAVSKADGLIDSVYTKKGKQLTNTWEAMTDVRSLETMIVPVEDKVFLKPSAYVANDTFIAVHYNGQYGGGWQSNAHLAAYDAQGNMLQVGGNAAKWKLTLQQNYQYSATKTTMNCAFSVPAGMTYNDIVAQLDAANFEGGYELKMIVEDTGAKNGVMDNFRGYNPSAGVAGLYVRADELCSTATKDVAVIPFGEIVTIDSVTVNEKGQMLVTFSHDIDVDHFLSQLADYSDFFLTISEKGANSFVKGADGANPLAQTPIGQFKKHSDNQIIGYVNPGKYNDMMAKFNAKKDTDNWAIRMRIEMPTGWNSTTGELPLHNAIKALDENVLSPFITMRNESRLWTDVDSCATLKPIEVKDGAATITGQNSFTFEWTEPVTMGGGYRGIRYVDENGTLLYYNADTDTVSTSSVNGTALQWATVLDYADNTKTKINGRLGGAGRFGVYDLADLIDPAADSEWGKIKAKYDGTLKVCMEEDGNKIQGFVDTYSDADGAPIVEYPLRDAGWDGIYMDLKGEVVKGELKVVSAKAITDAVVEVTFSGPVEFLSNPYTAIRIYKGNAILYYNPVTEEFTTNDKTLNADGKPMYTDADGNLTTESASADGSVKYTQASNMPMQWAANRMSISEDKTVVRYSISGRANAPVNGLNDLLTYDWESVGGKLYFLFEESGTHKVTYDQHVNNIVRADDPRIALEGNFSPDLLDRVRVDLPMAYTPSVITAKATVISDTQIRVNFSQPVDVDPNTYMAVRMLDKENNKLMWSGKENVSVAYQWPGSWEYANDAKTAIVWTINPSRSIWGAKNLYDLLNWAGPLVRYKAEGTFCFVMEEKNTTEKPTGRLNNLVETVASLDGTNHLIGNGGTGYDNLFMSLNSIALAGDELKLESVTAVDEQTLKVKFNRPIAIKEGDEGVSMAIRYLTESGDSETLTDGKTAIFNGDWKYDGDDKSTVIWTLNSKHTDSLTELLTYSGKFKWNSSARCAFVITDANADYYCPYRSMRINGITDMNGVHHLVANYSTEDYMMAQMDITVGYELPAVTIEPEQLIEYYSNYRTYIIVAAGLAVAFVVVAVIVAATKKKAR